jgi:hypothetical protein
MTVMTGLLSHERLISHPVDTACMMRSCALLAGRCSALNGQRLWHHATVADSAWCKDLP